MKRDFSNWNYYLDSLMEDVYVQSSDNGHTQNIKSVIESWIYPLKISSVLDVGCGAKCVAKNFFSGIRYLGITIGDEYEKGLKYSKFVKNMDMHFLDFDNNSIDLLFARHVLEHSVSPLLALMEWHRVSSKYLCVILPNPEHYTYIGKNHYSVMTSHHAAWLLRRAGWKMLKFNMNKEEIWFLCEKAPRISYEGWVKIPISSEIYSFERDFLEKHKEIDVIKYFKEKEMKYE